MKLEALLIIYLFCLDDIQCHIHKKRPKKGHHNPKERFVDVAEHHEPEFTPAPDKLRPHRDICSGDAVCVLPVQCPAHVRGAPNIPCSVIGGRRGICCISGHNHTSK